MAWITATAPTHCEPNTTGTTMGAARPSPATSGSQIVAVSSTLSE